jgi:hypothetical protein
VCTSARHSVRCHIPSFLSHYSFLWPIPSFQTFSSSGYRHFLILFTSFLRAKFATFLDRSFQPLSFVVLHKFFTSSSAGQSTKISIIHGHFSQHFCSDCSIRMTLARSLTKKIRRSLSIRTFSAPETEKSAKKKASRPSISFPINQPITIDRAPSIILEGIPEVADSDEPSPSSGDSSQSVASPHPSYMSTRSSRASSSSRTSYGAEDEGDVSDKKVSFTKEIRIIPQPKSRQSLASSIYGEEGILPPPIEKEEEIKNGIGKFRFSAAEYIREIEGTPLILVDGKLYL